MGKRHARINHACMNQLVKYEFSIRNQKSYPKKYLQSFQVAIKTMSAKDRLRREH